MDKSAILEKIKEIIKPYSKNPLALETITKSSDFTHDLKINSANLVDIFLDIEDFFGIDMDNSSLEKINSIFDAVDTIELKLKEKKILKK